MVENNWGSLGMNKHCLSVMIAASLLVPGAAMATNGMLPFGFGMKSKGMGGVGIALPQDSIAAATNPAGMVWVGNRVDFGLEAFYPDRSGSISGSQNPLFNGEFDGNETPGFYIPELGYNTLLNDDISFGVSLVGIGGMNVDYDQGIALFSANPQTQWQADTHAGIDLAAVQLSPSFAFKMGDHSLGLSVNLVAQQIKIHGIRNFQSPFVTTNPDAVSDNGYDKSYGAGLSLGWTGKFGDNLTIGAVYHSKNYMSKFDDYEGLLAEGGDLDTPAWYGLGFAWKADALTVALDITRIEYSGVNAISNGLQPLSLTYVCPPGAEANPECYAPTFAPGEQLGDSSGSGFGWNDIMVYKLGLSYKLNKQIMLRFGYSIGDQPIDDDQTLFNLLAPATIEEHITIGSTWTYKNGSEFTLYYMHAFENEVKGNSSIPPQMGGGEANISMAQDAWGMAYGWNF